MQLQLTAGPQNVVSEQRGGGRVDAVMVHVQLAGSMPSSHDSWLPQLDTHTQTAEPGNILLSDHWGLSAGPYNWQTM